MRVSRITSASAFTIASVSFVLAGSVDYVVVGAGTGGLALAKRLSDDDQISVAIVDPGADERGNPNTTNTFTMMNYKDTSIDWLYNSIPQASASGREFTFHAGKGIGGTSLVNGMVYIRGDKAQFDAWEELGNKGWNWDTMMHHYKKTEKLFMPGPALTKVGASIEPQYHGTVGDVHVAFNPSTENGMLYGSLKSAWASMGQRRNRDVNSGETHGFSVWPQTLDPEENRRWDAATAFYWPVQKRHNLKLHNGTVSKIIWQEQVSPKSKVRATGVEYIGPDSKAYVLHARKEVILAAGALRTPLILEHSGVGNPELLKQKGVELIVDLPAVGENMIDQILTPLLYRTDYPVKGFTPYATFVTAADIYRSNLREVASQTKAKVGQWARQVAQASHRGVNATALERIMSIQHDLIFNKNVTLSELLVSSVENWIGFSYWNLLPFTRGSVHMSNKGDINKPIIDPKYLFIDFDFTTQVESGKLSTKFWGTQPARNLIIGQVMPNSSVLPPGASDEQWRKFVADWSFSNSHALGTAAMMAKELGGVVDPTLKVYGTCNVRVVDASVLPMQFSGHLTATIYAVADRAADMILGKHI